MSQLRGQEQMAVVTLLLDHIADPTQLDQILHHNDLGRLANHEGKTLPQQVSSLVRDFSDQFRIVELVTAILNYDYGLNGKCPPIEQWLEHLGPLLKDRPAIHSHRNANNQLKEQNETLVLGAILDFITTRRAFFQGDDRALLHIVKMLDYNDAGRAVAVSRSLAAAALKFEVELARLRSATQSSIKEALADLIVASKDYAESHGDRPTETYLALPHIGWTQRLQDFTQDTSRYGFPSSDSFEVFKTLLEYLSRSFRELRVVREKALIVVERIIEVEPMLSERGRKVRSMISRGSDYLSSAAVALTESAQLVGHVIDGSADFQSRRVAAAALSTMQKDPMVAGLLLGASKLRNPLAWRC